MSKGVAHVFCGVFLLFVSVSSQAAGLSAWCDETRNIVVLAPAEGA